jgi:hypothetical protein
MEFEEEDDSDDEAVWRKAEADAHLYFDNPVQVPVGYPRPPYNDNPLKAVLLRIKEENVTL